MRVSQAQQIIEIIANEFAHQDRDLSTEEATAYLRKVLQRIENSLAAFCSRHSKLKLLLMSRTVITPNMFVGESQHPSLDLRPIQLETIAALKFGLENVEERLTNSGPPRIVELQESELADAIEIADHCWHYARLMKYWKALGAGGNLRLVNGYIHLNEHDSSLRKAADLENERIEKWNNYLSPAGAVEVPAFDNSAINLTNTILFALARLGTDSSDVRDYLTSNPYIHKENHGLLCNYIPFPKDISDILSLGRVYEAPIRQEYGVTPDEIVQCLHAMYALHTTLQTRSALAQRELLMTGLSVADRGRLLKDMVAFLDSRSSRGVFIDGRRLVERFSSACILTGDKFEALALHGGWLQSAIYGIGRFLVVDWVSMPQMLMNMLHIVTSSNEFKEVRGTRFERDIERWILSSSVGVERLLQPGQVLRLSGNTFGQIDVSFRVGNIGFIVECKAYAVSVECLRGDESATRNRWSYVEQWLSQVVKTTRLLASNPQGDNYRIPNDIHYLVPVVCSQHVEAVYDFDDKHFLSDNIPRVCTPQELLIVLASAKRQPLGENEYSFQVAH